MLSSQNCVIHTIKRHRKIVLFGASGHTGHFVVSELIRRGIPSILAGRDAEKLSRMSKVYPVCEIRVASVDDPASLDRALADTSLVINCAGPFLDTADAIDDPPRKLEWAFPAPFGRQEVVAFPLTETIIISRHLRTSEIWMYLNLAPLAELRDPPDTCSQGCGQERPVSPEVLDGRGRPQGRGGTTQDGSGTRHLCDYGSPCG